MGTQRTPAAQTYSGTNPAGYSPRYRANKAQERLKEQVMAMCDGDVLAYNQMMRNDVEVFILKFESFIKTLNRGS